MHVFITGGLGFVGSHLSRFLLNKGYRVTAVGRPVNQQQIQHANFDYVSGDTTQTGKWQGALKDADAVVNLAGESIFKRWSAKTKKQIYQSRILTSRNVVAALPQNKHITLCSASAVGYYGDRADSILTESDPPGNDFLANLSIDWETEALQAPAGSIRVVLMRFGIILGKNGGAMGQMISAFKAFVGGPLGSGDQWFPWLHMDDLLAAVDFAIENPDIRGAVNFCAPNPVRNRELAKTLGGLLKRPSFMPAPAFMLRLFLGEFGGVLLASQRMVPDKLLKAGFHFKYPEIREALKAIVNDEKEP